MPIGSTNVTTDIYNFVINTVGDSRFGQSMARAQDAINKVTLATNRAAQAAKTGRVSAELQRTQNEKLAASFKLSEARLDSFRFKMANAANTLADTQTKEARLAAEIAKTTARLAYQEAQYAKLTAATKKNVGLISQIKAAMESTKQTLKEQTAEQTRLTQKTTEGTQREKLYQAQLKAREARLDAQRAKLNEVQKPLSRFESFLATMIQVYNIVNKASTAYEKLSKNVERTLRIVEKVKGLFGGGTNQPTLASQSGLSIGGNVTNVIGKVTSGLSFLGATAAHVLGDIIVGGLRAVVQGFEQMAQAAVSSVARFERLNLSFKSLLAVQLTDKDATLSISDAMQRSGAEAAKLIRWLEKLAILSPFTSEDVQNAFRNALAMGFNTNEAARLTKATLDWAAATGHSGAEAEHATYVLGQMRSAGKLLYQDLYQLAQLGIGMDAINKQLAKDLGKTVDQIKAMREEGQITAAQGVTAIVEYMERFQGAASAQAHTLDGLLSSLSDIGPIFLRSFFGPLNEATGQVEGFLGAVRKRLDSFVTFLQSEWAIKNTAVLGRTFGKWAENAFTWGENIVKQLANGMLNAAFALLDALANIGKMIAYWLAPGSPPRLLPDIDKWGMAAMGEFLNGFKLADMNVFKDVGATLESVLRSTITTQEGDKVGILERIFGTRSAVGELVDMLRTTGSVTEGMFQRVFAAIGGPTKAVQDYLRAYIALEQQNKQVTAAQDNLNKVTKYYENLLAGANKEVNRITEAQQDLADEQQKFLLEMIINDPNATAGEKAQARLEIEKMAAAKRLRLLQTEADTNIKTAQDQLDTETAKQQQLAEQLELQKALVDAQIDQNALVTEYIDLLKSLQDREKAGGAGGGEMPTPSTPFALTGTGPKLELPDIATAFDKMLERLRVKFEQKIAVLRSIWRSLWYNHILPLFEPFKQAWERVQTAWDKFTAAIGEKGPKIQETIAHIIADIITFVADKGPKFLDTLTSIIETLTRIWEKHGDTIIAVIGLLVVGVVGAIMLMIQLIVGIIDVGLKIIEGILDFASHVIQLALTDPWRLAWEVLTGILKGIVWLVLMSIKVIGDIILTVLTWAIGFWTGAWNVILTVAQTIWGLIVTGIALALMQAKTTITEFKIAAVEKIKAIIQWLVEHWHEAKDEIVDRITEAKDKAVELAQDIYDGITGKIGEILAYLLAPETLQGFIDAGTNFVQGIIDGIASMAGALATAIQQMVAGMFGTAQDEGEQHSPSQRAAREIGKPFVQGIQLGIAKELKGLRTSVVGAMGQMVMPPASAAQIGATNVVTNNSKTVNYSPTYNAPPPSAVSDWAVVEILSN